MVYNPVFSYRPASSFDGNGGLGGYRNFGGFGNFGGFRNYGGCNNYGGFGNYGAYNNFGNCNYGAYGGGFYAASLINHILPPKPKQRIFLYNSTVNIENTRGRRADSEWSRSTTAASIRRAY